MARKYTIAFRTGDEKHTAQKLLTMAESIENVTGELGPRFLHSILEDMLRAVFDHERACRLARKEAQKRVRAKKGGV